MPPPLQRSGGFTGRRDVDPYDVPEAVAVIPTSTIKRREQAPALLVQTYPLRYLILLHRPTERENTVLPYGCKPMTAAKQKSPLKEGR